MSMPHETNWINAIIVFHDMVLEMRRKMFDDNGNDELLEVVMKIILHQMMDGKKTSIQSTLLARNCDYNMLGRIVHKFSMREEHAIAKYYGMTFSDWLT